MAINCSYHPSRVAHFHCHKCGDAFCDNCVSRRQTPQYGQMRTSYFCPTCNVPAEHLGLGNVIEPFWSCLPRIFGYPLQLSTLLFIIIVAGVAALFPGSFLVQLLFFIVSTKFAYTVLTTTAQGSLQPPQLSFDLFNQDVLQVFKQYIIFAIVGSAAGFIFNATGMIGGAIFLAVVVFYAPTMLMILVATNSVFAALNPFVFVPIVNRIGWRYLLMYLFIILLYGAPATAFHYIPTTLPLYFRAFLYFSLNLYYTIVIYHLLGYVLLQYHEEIGFDVDYEYFMEKSGQVDKQVTDPKSQLLTTISILIKNGKYEEALERIALETNNQFGDDLELAEKHLTLLQMTQKKEEMQKYGAVHLNKLIQRGKKAKVIKFYTDFYCQNPDIGIPSLALLQIGNWLKERGDALKAKECYIRFIKANKGHEKLPEAYFSLAQILHENSNNSAKAREIVNWMLKTYPQHALAADMNRYLATMI